jgi:small redox-active disulfide protein 2
MEVIVKIQILGMGCIKCQLLEEHAREALASLGMTAEVEKVTDLDEIMNMGVMMTPALVVDGVVKSVGKVLTKEQIGGIINGGK